MANQESKLLLKILSGNQQGSEAALDYGTVVIGSDFECDIVLSDSLIEPRHIELTVSESGVTVKPVNGKVFVDGKLINDETAHVEEFQFITIGSTHIVIGPSDKTWPFISAADAPQIGSGERHEEAEPEEIHDVTPAHLVSDVKKPSKKKMFILWGTVLFLLGVILTLIIATSAFSSSAQPLEQKDIELMLKNAVSDMKLSKNVSIEKDAFGHFEARGYVASGQEMSDIRRKLFTIDPGIKIKIYDESRILSEISTLLSGLESKPRVRTEVNGVFVLTGYAADEDKWNKIRRRILEDIVGIVDLQDEVILPKKAAEMVRPVLAKYKLINKVAISPQADGIAVVGLVSSEEEENWNRARIQIEQMFSSDVLIKNYVKISDPEVIKRQYFGSEISSVSMTENGMNWIGLKDGTKYMVGATLSNGYCIREITPENVVLTKGNQTVVLKLGDLK